MLKKAVIFCSIFLLSGSLHAGLVINPSRAEINLKSGESYGSSYNVKNEYGVPIDVGVAKKDWFVLPENKKQGINVSKWLSVSTEAFHLNPGESKKVSYKVTVSSGSQGVMVGMISFLPKSGVETGVNLVVSVPVYVTVAGTEKKDWKVDDVKIEVNGKELLFSCKVENKGNIHLRPKGFVEIMSGKRTLTNFSLLENRPVYPGTERTFTAKTDFIPEKGNYLIIAHVSCAGEEKVIEKKIKIKKSGELVLK